MENHFNGCYIQIGLLEKIRPEDKSFATISEAFQYTLRRNKEFAIILWNGIPLRLSYVKDLPFMIEHIIVFLDKIVVGEEAGGDNFYHCVFQSKNLQFDWKMEWDAESLEIRSHWEKVPGKYESALNALSLIKMMKKDFIAEWKILLEQLIRAFQDAHARIYDPDQTELFDTLLRVNQSIERRGRYYRTNNGNETGFLE